MTRIAVARFFLPALLPALLPSQIIVVDASNGPGTHYTSIAAATAAAPDGAFLQVRAGTYDNFRIINKSLTVDAESGVVVRGSLFQYPPIEVVDLDSSQAASVRGFRFGIVFGGVAISCRDSAGAIVVEQCSTDDPMTLARGMVRATNCEHVYLRDCQLRSAGLFAAPFECFNSNLAAYDCQLQSENFCFRLGGSRVHLTGCTIDSTPSPAIPTAVGTMVSSTIVLNGGTTLQSHATSEQAAIAGDGVAVLDPSVQLLGSTGPIEPTIAVEDRRLPHVVAATDPIGGTAQGTLHLTPGELGTLFVGFPDQPEFFPGIADPFWLGDAVVQATGSGATVSGSYAVPNATWVLGVQITWQGATHSLGTSLVHVGNPATYTHY